MALQRVLRSVCVSVPSSSYKIRIRHTTKLRSLCISQEICHFSAIGALIYFLGRGDCMAGVGWIGI